MKQIIMVILAMVATTLVRAQTPAHPRLFFSTSEIPTLQSRATTQTTPPTKAYELWTQIIRDKEADYFAFGTQGSPGSSNKSLVISDAWQTENFYSIALAYIITNNAAYLNAAKDILFGYTDSYTHIFVTGLVSTAPFDQPGYFDATRYRVAQVTTLSMVADLLWDQLTTSERTQILQKVKQEVDYIDPSGGKQGVREFVFSGYAHIQNNHLARYGQALLYAAITFYGESGYPDAANDIERMRKLFVTNLDGKNNIVERLYDTEGGQVEGVEYSMVGVASVVPIIHVLKRWDGVDYFSNTEIQKRLSKMPNWWCYEVLPGPRTSNIFFNNINDSDVGSAYYQNMGFADNGKGLLTTVLMLGGYYSTVAVPWLFQNTAQLVAGLQTSTDAYWQRYNRANAHLISLLKYNELSMIGPETILPKSKLFPERGLVYVRTSSPWADNHDIQFALEGAPCINPVNGTFSIKHDQADKNHFTLNAFGKQFIRDFGRGGDVYGKRPETHNYIWINIDGQMKGQAIGAYLSGGNQIADWNPRPGKISAYTHDGTYTFIHGDAKDAFGNLYTHDGNGVYRAINSQSDAYFTGKDPAWAYVNPVINADRYVNFNQAESNVPPYIIMADDINKDNTSREYQWLFHSDYSASGTNPIVITAGNSFLKIWHNEYQNASNQLLSQQVTIPLGGSPLPDKTPGLGLLSSPIYINSSQYSIPKTAINPYFHVVMIPFESSSQTQPTVTTITTSNGSCFNIDWPDYSDYSMFRYTSGTVSNNVISSNAKLVQVRKNKSTSQVTSFAMNEGSNFTFNGTLLAETYGVNTIVMFSNSKVTIDGQGIGYFRVYAPGAASVKINSTEVGFVQVGDYVESNNVSVNRTWSGNISSNYPVTVSATLKIDPGSIFKIGYGLDITVNGKLVAKGDPSNRITFTSTNPTPTAGDWQGIVCSGGGPDTLTYCNIKYAYDGLRLMNTAANSYMQNDTISRSAYYGLFVSNTGTANTSLKMYKCGVNNNDGRAVQVNNAKVLVSYTRVESNELQFIGLSNFYVCNGGKVYMDSTRIQNNIGTGIDVSGSYSRVSLSKDEVQPGYNTVTQSGAGEIYVHNSATAFLGYVTSTLHCECPDNKNKPVLPGAFSLSSLCPPDCTPGYTNDPKGGWNNVFNDKTYNCRLINNTTTGIIRARYTYWGTGSNMFCGSVDASSPLGDPINTPSKAGIVTPIVEIAGIIDEQKQMIDWLIQLKRDIEDNKENAIDALYQLALHAGPGGEYQSVLALPWETFLSAIETSTLPAKLKMLAVGLRLQSMLDQNQFRSTITLSNQILSRKGITTDLWLYLQTRKIFASVGMGDSVNAWSIFNGIKNYGVKIDSSAIKTLEEYLTLTIGHNNGKIASVNNPFENSGENVDYIKPATYSLVQNYPNPFNPVTLIQYGLPEQSHVTLKIYDILGREVRTLVDEVQEAGYKSVMFDAGSIPSGVYFYRIQAGKFVDMKKMLLIR